MSIIVAAICFCAAGVVLRETIDLMSPDKPSDVDFSMYLLRSASANNRKHWKRRSRNAVKLLRMEEDFGWYVAHSIRIV